MWELSAYRPVFILFPNLVTFEWAGGVKWLEEELPVLLGFLNPNIAKIRIANWRYDQAPLRSSISLIASRFTHLKDLQLVNATPPGPKDSHLVMPSILSLVRKSTTLEGFEFTHLPLAEDIFGALAAQRNLTRLAIRLPKSVAWSTINILDVAHFPALREITIFSRSQDYIDFCSKASFPRVKVVQIRLADVPFQQNDLLRIFASLCAQFSASALKRLIVVMDDTSLSRAQLGQVASRVVVRLEDLQLFFKFEKLSLFKLSIASCYALDPAAYLAMAKAWPHLKSFELGRGEFCTHPNPAGIRDVLVPFAVHCPKLTSLGVRFRADISIAGLGTSVAIANALPPGEPSTSPVYSLDCFDSPVARTPYVAALLALLFPKLRLILLRRSVTHTGHLWDEVQLYLPLFTIVREDGRREAAKEMLQS